MRVHIVMVWHLKLLLWWIEMDTYDFVEVESNITVTRMWVLYDRGKEKRVVRERESVQFCNWKLCISVNLFLNNSKKFSIPHHECRQSFFFNFWITINFLCSYIFMLILVSISLYCYHYWCLKLVKRIDLIIFRIKPNFQFKEHYK